MILCVRGLLLVAPAPVVAPAGLNPAGRNRKTAMVLSVGDGDTLRAADGPQRLTIRLACMMPLRWPRLPINPLRMSTCRSWPRSVWWSRSAPCQPTSKTAPLPTPKSEPPPTRSGASFPDWFRLGCAGGASACSCFSWLVALVVVCH